MLYLDSSALVKLAVDEAESEPLSEAVWGRRLHSSALARTEVPRACARAVTDGLARGRRVLALCRLVRLDPRLLDTAAALQPLALRSLDAIHVAAALTLGDALDAVVTYDERMADAARAAGLEVRAPA